MTIVASNSLTISNVNDGTITHVAYANSADGTDGFTTVYPNLNLLDGTKDFSGNWKRANNWENDGTYKGLTVKKRTGQFSGINKTFTAPKNGVYTFSAYIKSSGNNANIYRYVGVNSANGGAVIPNTFIGNNFDWLRNSFQVTLKTGDTVWARYEITSSGTDSILWTAGHKWEDGSTATPYMLSASEVTTADWPKYIGHYTDFTQADSTNPSDYTWGPMRGDDGKDGATGKDGIAGKDGNGIKTTVITYAISTSGTTAPNTGWTSSVPSLVKGQYLWTKTVWTYTDNSFETGYSVTYISKDGNNGHDGIAGKDGTGIKTTVITYAISTSGTTAPSSGWTSTIPTVAAGSYLWTKTVWVYTDNTSETGYSVAKMGNTGATGPQGPQGNTGPQGPAGSNGDPGKIVSDTEPSTRFKGLTWKYSGTSDLTASDGTVIKPNTEYYYNGTHWMINYLSANNLEANSIKADKIDAKNLTITDGEFVSTTTNGPVTTSTEIKDNHIAISKTDGTVNTKNDLAVDTEQGFAMKFTNNTTGLTREASVNFQGVSTSDSNGNYAQLTPQGTKLSTDVPWTDITRASGVGTSGTLRARINNGVFYAQSKDVTIPSIAPNSLITIGTMSSKFSGVSGFDTLGLLYSPGQLSVASVTVGNDGKINIGNPNPTTMSGKVIQFSINIPLG
ncbi:Phage capsid and scaffold [Lactococcus lactis subsp. lactis bv. diacetylactis]|nr:collagen-like protein [Lactococcus lactis]QEX49195.1 Phage capsid and scaffold [Lactococcus lactis subsp. lactis bv. diacetylactis]QTP69305.1 collagen-like protein [Lactococcus lactis subsp. lactis bv. diacetylactis]